MRNLRTGLLMLGLTLMPLCVWAEDPSTAPKNDSLGSVHAQTSPATPVSINAIFGGCALKSSSPQGRQTEDLPRWMNFGQGGSRNLQETVCSCGGTCGKISGCNCDYCSGCSSSDCSACCSEGCAENCGTSTL